MNDTTQKIAAEAAEAFCEKHGLVERSIYDDLTRAFQSAIEKATEEITKDRDLRKAQAESCQYLLSRARQHASEPWGGDTWHHDKPHVRPAHASVLSGEPQSGNAQQNQAVNPAPTQAHASEQ